MVLKDYLLEETRRQISEDIDMMYGLVFAAGVSYGEEVKNELLEYLTTVAREKFEAYSNMTAEELIKVTLNI